MLGQCRRTYPGSALPRRSTTQSWLTHPQPRSVPIVMAKVIGPSRPVRSLSAHAHHVMPGEIKPAPGTIGLVVLTCHVPRRIVNDTASLTRHAWAACNPVSSMAASGAYSDEEPETIKSSRRLGDSDRIVCSCPWDSHHILARLDRGFDRLGSRPPQWQCRMAHCSSPSGCRSRLGRRSPPRLEAADRSQ
jgi:hypothetical protein